METVISSDILDKLKKQLIDLNVEWSGIGKPTGPYGAGGVCKGLLWTPEGAKLPGVTPHTACHSWVSNAFREIVSDGSAYGAWGNRYKTGAKNFIVGTAHSKARSNASPEATDAIILWMASDASPFGKYFLNRDDPHSLTEGGAILLCGPDGLNHSQAMWVCKVLRYGYEGNQAFDTWKTLTDGGADPMLSILVAHHITDLKGATFSFAKVSDHCSVFGSSYGDANFDVRGLLTRNFNPSPTNTQSVFVKAKSDKTKAPSNTEVVSTLEKFCTPFIKSDGWGGSVTGRGVKAEELVKQVLKWQEELGGASLPPLTVSETPYTPGLNTVYLDVDM